MIILFALIVSIGNAQEKKKKNNFLKEIFKYSTFYSSFTESSPLITPDNYFVTQLGDVINITPDKENDYNISVGIRKIARFDYENKAKKYYDGTENNSSLNSNVGSIRGLEYLFQYSKGMQRGMKFTSERYYMRYSGKWWSSKLEMNNNGLIDLNYKSADLRVRLPIKGNFSISIGSTLRTHKPYGYNPIESYLSSNAWWDLAYSYNYQDHYYGIDYDNDGFTDEADWWWSDSEGNRVADTDLDFRRNVYQNIVNDYNRRELDKIGTLGTLSGVLGIDYYIYRNNWYLHAFANMYPIHKHMFGDEEYSYEVYVGKDNWLDYNAGLMYGWDISSKLGLFTEYEITKFWDKELSFLKAGINYKF